MTENIPDVGLRVRIEAPGGPRTIYDLIIIQGVTGGTDQTSGGCSLC